MTTQNSKTIISYSGGSAGDLFTLSCNGEVLTELTNIRVSQSATLKGYEHKVKMGENPSLVDELNTLPYQYVNTHMLDEIVGMDIPVYNVVISNKDVQLTTVHRQMQIQHLRVEIDHNEYSWYYTIKKHVDSDDYQSAAEYWLEKTTQYWLDRMEYRLNFTKTPQIDFSKLYSEDFADDLKKQSWTHNIELLRQNHQTWIKKNKDFSYEKTLESMKQKIMTMDWNQKEGWIFYHPN